MRAPIERTGQLVRGRGRSHDGYNRS